MKKEAYKKATVNVDIIISEIEKLVHALLHFDEAK